jgi:beta-aspartyl-peptidase (threonine type)
MRLALAKTTTDALRLGDLPEQAARSAVRLLGTRLGGTGGLIVLDAAGRLGLARNTANMAWAAVGASLSVTSGA